MESARQAQGQLADVHVGRVQRRFRGIALRAKRRVEQQLGRPEPVQPVEAHSRVPGAEYTLSDNRYPQWIALYDTLDADARAALTSDVEALKDSPLISIVFPVYNTPEEYLRRAIESIRGQIYGNWELCISDDCSTEPHVVKVLDEYTALDERIHVVRRTENGHISASSNSAIALANGEWICLMDHDDLLAEHALAVAAIALRGHPVPRCSTATRTIFQRMTRGRTRTSNPISIPFSSWARTTSHISACCGQTWCARSAASDSASRAARIGTSSCVSSNT